MLFNPANLNSNLTLTLGYLNPALNNPAQDSRNSRFRAMHVTCSFSPSIFHNCLQMFVPRRYVIAVNVYDLTIL